MALRLSGWLLQVVGAWSNRQQQTGKEARRREKRRGDQGEIETAELSEGSPWQLRWAYLLFAQPRILFCVLHTGSVIFSSFSTLSLSPAAKDASWHRSFSVLELHSAVPFRVWFGHVRSAPPLKSCYVFMEATLLFALWFRLLQRCCHK